MWENISLKYDYDEAQAITEKKVLFTQIKKWMISYINFLETKKEGIPKKILPIITAWKQKKLSELNEKNYAEYLRYLDESMETFMQMSFMLGIIKFHKEGTYVNILDESEEAIIGIKKIKEK